MLRVLVQTTITQFHVIGLKCKGCGSYNTSRCGNEEIPTESQSESEDEDEDDEIEEDARLALLQQRLSTMVSRLNRSMERRNNDNSNAEAASNNSDRTQEMMLHSFVDQLQLFQGLLSEISGNYDDADEEADSSEDTSSSEESDDDGTKESDLSDSSNDLEADDEGDSSNPHSPSYSFFSQPHPINLEDFYGSLDDNDDDDDDDEDRGRDDRTDSSWETEEEQEVIGEVGSSNWGDTSYCDIDSNHDSHDISDISGSLGTVTLDCPSGREEVGLAMIS